MGGGGGEGDGVGLLQYEGVIWNKPVKEHIMVGVNVDVGVECLGSTDGGGQPVHPPTNASQTAPAKGL